MVRIVWWKEVGNFCISIASPWNEICSDWISELHGAPELSILSISTLRSSLSLLICEYGNSFLNQCIASSVKKCLFYACYVPIVWLPWNCWFNKVLSAVVHQTLEIKYLIVHSHVYFAIICHYPSILPLSLSLFLAHGLRNG